MLLPLASLYYASVYTKRTAAAARAEHQAYAAAHPGNTHEAGAHEARAHERNAHEIGTHEVGAHEARAHERNAHEAGEVRA